MINESEIKALISLLDDTDNEVVSQVEKRLFQLGPEIIPALEQPWDLSDINELRQRRLDEIIKRIQSHTLTNELRNWKQSNQSDLLEGVLILNRVKYPDVIALCIEAIKEQSVLLDIKENKLKVLEERAKEKGLI